MRPANPDHTTMKSTGPDHSALFTSLMTAAALLGVGASTQAQGPDDEHWFYGYDGPRPEPFVFEIDENYLYAGGLFLSSDGQRWSPRPRGCRRWN